MARGGRPIPWGPLFVAVLAVAVGALVVLALQPPAPPSTDTAGVDTPAASPEPSATESPRPTDDVEPTDDGSAQAGLPLRERPVDALSATAAVRALAGECEAGGGLIELSTDGGSSWVPVTTPADQVVRVSWAAEDDLWFVGASQPDCVPAFTRSADQGVEWEAPSSSDGAWHLLPERGATQVHAPDGDVDSPCRGDGLEIESVSADEAYLLCANGDVELTRDAGASWESVGGDPGAVALGLVGGTPVLARAGVEGCDGLSVGALDEGEPACVDGAPGRRVGLAFAGQAGFLLAGPGVWTSADGGTGWQQVLAPQ
jgi:hypothetical protein